MGRGEGAQSNQLEGGDFSNAAGKASLKFKKNKKKHKAKSLTKKKAITTII